MLTIKTIGAPATIGHLEIPGVDSDPILVKDPDDLKAVRRFFRMNMNLSQCYIITKVKPIAEPKAEPKAAPKAEVKPAPKAEPKAEDRPEPKAEPRKVAPKGSTKKSKFFGKA